MSDLVFELRPPEGRHYLSWAERLDAVARFSRADAVHAVCEEAYAIGARAILAVFDPTIREALTTFQRWRDVPVWAVVPNMQAFIRDLTDLGMVGAAKSRFLRLKPADMIRLGLGVVPQVKGVLKKDFATGTTLVADMELAGLRGLKLTRIFLHPQVTEIALAGGVTAVFTALADRAERMGLEAGLLTHNPVRAAAVLGSTLGRFKVVIAPANPKGYKMFPSRATCEQLFQSDPGRFLATEITAGGAVDRASALAYVRQLGMPGALVDVTYVEAAFRAGTPAAAPVAARASGG